MGSRFASDRWRFPSSWSLSRARPASSAGFSVLDLGPATPSNLEFFLGRGARLTVADFAPSRGDTLSELIRAEPGTHFDLVLAWDFLNYLPRERLGLLAAKPRALLPPGNDRPRAHRDRTTNVRNAEALPDRGRGNAGVRKGREDGSFRRLATWSRTSLRCMPGLIVEHRFQLRNEMLEYLFSYRTRLRVAYSAPAPSGRRDPFSVGRCGAWIALSTFPMNSGRPSPIHRTTTTRSFSQSM